MTKTAVSEWPSWATRVVAIVVPVTALAWVAGHWSAVDGGADALGRARLGWLLLAAAAARVTWVAGAACQQGSVAQRLPLRPLLAVQLAGSAANHVLPAGVGVAAVNMRYLRRLGLSRSEALNAVGLNTLAGIAVHVVATIALVAVGATSAHVLVGGGVAAGVVVGVAAMVALVLLAVPAARRGILRRVRPARSQWAQVSRNRRRLVQLWAGSASVPVLHALTMLCVSRALDVGLGIGTAFGVYFIASSISAAVPSPGGFGSLDAALTLGLHAAGVTTSLAVAMVLAYRLITVWLPLLPSACTIGVLRHRALL